jgi:hypothetical protein
LQAPHNIGVAVRAHAIRTRSIQVRSGEARSLGDLGKIAADSGVESMGQDERPIRGHQGDGPHAANRADSAGRSSVLPSWPPVGRAMRVMARPERRLLAPCPVHRGRAASCKGRFLIRIERKLEIEHANIPNDHFSEPLHQQAVVPRLMEELGCHVCKRNDGDSPPRITARSIPEHELPRRARDVFGLRTQQVHAR